MKPSLILLLLFLAVTGTAILYSGKFAGTRTSIDLFNSALSAVPNAVSRDEVIRFVSNTNDPMFFRQSQFVVAPRMVTMKDSLASKWTLYVDRLGMEKSPVDTTVQTVYWQKSDSLFFYRLTSKKSRP